mmetsp:Transcript_25278/g.37232  ORF Transcript_25278/g.37232 Transcript_25278/m.37232 type:complete len:202 (-) Transcript_25278:2954-3559(-)
MHKRSVAGSVSAAFGALRPGRPISDTIHRAEKHSASPLIIRVISIQAFFSAMLGRDCMDERTELNTEAARKATFPPVSPIALAVNRARMRIAWLCLASVVGVLQNTIDVKSTGITEVNRSVGVHRGEIGACRSCPRCQHLCGDTCSCEHDSTRRNICTSIYDPDVGVHVAAATAPFLFFSRTIYSCCRAQGRTCREVHARD